MKTLKGFLESWLEWAEGEAIHGKPYRNYWGLCANVEVYVTDNYTETDYPTVNRLNQELANKLTIDCGEEVYPFGEANYEYYNRRNSQHLDPVRLAWVKKTIKELS